MAEDRRNLSLSEPPPETTVAYGNDEDQVADVWFGGATGERRPLVVVVHGGFWRPQYDRMHSRPMSAALAAGGWTTASVEYRRHPHVPQRTLDDIALAMETLPSLIPSHSGSIVAVGHSAGGHLALWAGATPGLLHLIAVVALAPLADLSLAHQLGLGSGAVEAFLGADPVERADVDPTRMQTPQIPITLIHGVDDEIVPISVSESYVSSHPAARLVPVPEAGHFPLIDPTTDAWATVVDAIQLASDSTAKGAV